MRISVKTSTIGRRISPAHSAEILRDEFLRPMKTSVYELANALKVPRTCANDIVLAPLRSGQNEEEARCRRDR